MGCGSPSAAEVAPAEIIEPSPSSDVPSDPQFPKSYRPSIISLQIPNEFGDDVSSDALSDRSDAQEENVDYLYATDVTLQWLLERIADKFKKTISEDPQWIIERLNRPSWDLDYATSSVVRVTFGWDDDDLPRSVVLKTPVAKDQREDEEGKYHYIMFKRSKFPKLVAPNIIHIKKHSKEGSGVVVMEDVSEKGQEQDPVKGLSLEVVRDLLKQIAYLHSVSLKHTSWSTLVADLPPSYYAHTIGNFDDTMTFFERQDVDHSRFVVEGHSGCFAEDVAKIICWNLNAKERVDNPSSLLEGYHFHLARYYDGDCPFTVDIIQRCYEVFVPFAMVSLCGKVMGLNNKTEKEPLIERAKSLIQQVYAMERLNET
ncbi:unnamed protein product [Caenorhabditis brenneri]